jgi:putative membrane protein
MDPSKTWTPYCGVAPLPTELMLRWNFDPVLLVAFAAAVVMLFALHLLHDVRVQSSVAAFIAFVVSALIFISPFCALASALFSVRVSHHILLVGIISPLFVLAFSQRAIATPLLAMFFAVLHAVIFWAWHYPPIYEAALSTNSNYWFMQVTLAASAAAVWYAVRASSVPTALAVLLFTMMQMGLLGALLTFAPEPVFAPHILTTEAWGLTSLEDQQLAGVIMWVAGSGIYLAAALTICSRLFYRQERAIKC